MGVHLTPNGVLRLNALVVARAEINAFLKTGYNQRGSMVVAPLDYHEIGAIEQATIVKIVLTDLAGNDLFTLGGEDCTHLLSLALPRIMVERMLRAELKQIEAELVAHGVTLEETV